jgi:hypothetical protein
MKNKIPWKIWENARQVGRIILSSTTPFQGQDMYLVQDTENPDLEARLAFNSKRQIVCECKNPFFYHTPIKNRIVELTCISCNTIWSFKFFVSDLN